MEGSVDTGGGGGEDISAMHRRFFETGQLTELMMTSVALEALERADVQLFIDVTNVTRQSDDPEVLDRTSKLLSTYADMAEGIVRDDAGNIIPSA